MQGIVSSLSNAVVTSAAAEGELRELKSASGSDKYSIDGSTQGKYLELIKLEKQFEDLRIRNKKSPWVRKLLRKIEVAREALKLSTKQRIRQANITLKANKAREKLLRKEFDQLKTEIESLKIEERNRAKVRLQHSILRSEFESAKSIFHDLNTKLEDVYLNLGNEQKTVTLRDSAVVPRFHSSPNEKFNIILALIFGPLLGAAIAYVLDFFDDTIRTSQELSRSLNLDVIGTIPSFKLSKKSSWLEEEAEVSSYIVNGAAETLGEIPYHQGSEYEEGILVAIDSMFSGEAESFRRIRAVLKNSSSYKAPKLILITSAVSGDGKSVVAANLATSFALATDKTLLIDADLHRPSLCDIFKLKEDCLGVSNYLRGSCALDSVIYESVVPNLSLMPAGSSRRMPSELVASKRMHQFLEQARNGIRHNRSRFTATDWNFRRLGDFPACRWRSLRGA